MQTIANNPGFSMPKVKLPLAIAVGIGMIFDIPCKLLSLDLPVNSDRMRKFGTATYFTALKIRAAGFVQKQSIEQSITEMCNWYMQSLSNNKEL